MYMGAWRRPRDRGWRSSSKRERSCWSKIATSPSRTRVGTGRVAIAAATSSKALGVIDSGAAQQPNPIAILVGEDAPAVDFLLEDPAGTVEGLADERGDHREVVRDHPGDLPCLVPSYGRRNQ